MQVRTHFYTGSHELSVGRIVIKRIVKRAVTTEVKINTLQHVLQPIAMHCPILHNTATHCNTHGNILQQSAPHCTTLHHPLQHTATHYRIFPRTPRHVTTRTLQHATTHTPYPNQCQVQAVLLIAPPVFICSNFPHEISILIRLI